MPPKLRLWESFTNNFIFDRSPPPTTNEKPNQNGNSCYRGVLTLFPFLVKKIWAVWTSKETGSIPQPIRSPELHFVPNCRPFTLPL